MRTVVIGAANLDISGRSLSPMKLEDSNPGLVASAAGGVGRNIAENLARLGASTALVTMLGNDVGKSLILESCQVVGIDTSSVIFSDAHSTGTYLAINDHQGQLAVAINDMRIYEAFTPDVLKTRSDFIEDADEIVIEANLPQETLLWICEQYGHKPIHADTVSAAKASRIKPVLNKLDLLKINRLEALALLKCSDSGITNQSLIEQIYETGVKQVLLTMGRDGALLRCNQGLYHHSPFPVTITSDTGAGDALLAGFIIARQLFDAREKQLAFCLGCAAQTLQTASAVSSTLEADSIVRRYLTPGA